jgi:hypothetical protein
MIASREIENISFEGNLLKIEVDGKSYKINLNTVSQKLYHASKTERSFFKISPSGYGIHWPLIDEDLAIDTLIK